jgi:hypothetical protein
VEARLRMRNLIIIIGIAIYIAIIFGVYKVIVKANIKHKKIIVSLIYMLYIIISSFVRNDFVPGWATIITLICLFSGFQILCIGVIGEYIGKIYSETKSRPRYIIQDFISK